MVCLLYLNYWAFYLLHSFMRNCTHPSSPVPSTGCHTSPPSQQWLQWHHLGFTASSGVPPPSPTPPPHPRERPRWNQIISLTLPPRQVGASCLFSSGQIKKDWNLFVAASVKAEQRPSVILAPYIWPPTPPVAAPLLFNSTRMQIAVC